MTGILLAIVSVIVVFDYLLALYFLARANRARDVGAPLQLDSEGEVDNPETLRRVAHILMLTAPLIWLVAAAFSFGLVPVDGIVPLKF